MKAALIGALWGAAIAGPWGYFIGKWSMLDRWRYDVRMHEVERRGDVVERRLDAHAERLARLEGAASR